MSPSESSSARARAHHVLTRVTSAGAYASILLDRHEAELADPRDAALLRETVLGVLRHRAALDHVVRQVASRPLDGIDPPVLVALRLGAYELLYLDRVPEFAAVDEAVELVKPTGPTGPSTGGTRERHAGAAGFVNGVLRRIANEGRALLPAPPEPGDLEALATYRSHPRWWVARLVERRGWDAADALLAADNRPAPLVLRPNLERIGHDELRLRLSELGAEVEPGQYDEQALRVRAGARHARTAVREGLAWAQDEAAQLVPRLFGPGRVDRIVDLCAAPGTKTRQLAEGLAPGGMLLAVDRHAGRLGRLRRASRDFTENPPQVVLADAGARPGAIRGAFDRVLLDAPCTGTGTLRRHPEIRWRLEPGDVARLSQAQRRLLEAAADRVARGGRLVYSVCSLEAEEGARRVRRFLASRTDFRLADAGEILPAACKSLVTEGCLITSPDVGELDGFFAAAIDRVG